MGPLIPAVGCWAIFDRPLHGLTSVDNQLAAGSADILSALSAQRERGSSPTVREGSESKRQRREM